MDTVSTPYGRVPVTGVVERFGCGAVRSCTPACAAIFETPYGALEAQHSTDDLRRRTVQAVSFHENGALRALPLEKPTRIETPAGPMSVELATFHPDGSLCRAFPLNGKLSGYWTQEDEGRLARPLELATPVGAIRARLIGVCFAPGGAMLSLTLWPGEVVDVPTPAGLLAARIGISFRPGGRLRSLEPARPQAVPTPAGIVQAYDLDAVGICGDVNSLGFGPDGTVSRVSTTLTRILASGPHEDERTYVPQERESLCGDGEREPVPMRLEFGGGLARIKTRTEDGWDELELSAWTLRAEPFLREFGRPFGRLGCAC
ncbi:MAG: hypothetical protein HY916_08540 [Desulfovibrio sp.]|jgi:hypothetical protein|nr:hypothetical protein [Desulfovibrio sp.]